MMSFGYEEAVYLATGSTDMRCSIDGLVAIITLQFKLDPFSPCLFVFCNRRKDRIKAVYWDHNGFWLLYRRLEQGVFQWPDEGEVVTRISSREFRWLLDGLSPVQRQAHKPVLARVVI